MNFSPESKGFSTNYTLNIHGRLLDLSKPVVMGILNVTPDSFFDGNLYRNESGILKRAGAMLNDGAMIVDIGGYSTRPGAPHVSEEEEIDRILSAIRPIKKHFPDSVISIDTFRSSVARVAVSEGAGMINDVSGGNLDEQMFQTVRDLRVPYVLMHMRGDPQTMRDLNEYDHLLTDVITDLQKKLDRLTQLGVPDVIVDPGFGFAKNIDQNFEMLSALRLLRILERPLLIGLSRKSMIWKTLRVSAAEALGGTIALNTIALLEGANILRVHDVKEAVQTIELVGRVQQKTA